MAWSEDGIVPRKLSWFEKRRIKKREKERLDRERQYVLSRAFENFVNQCFSK